MTAVPKHAGSFDWKRLVFMLTGVALFTAVYFSPAWPDAVDPMGEHFILSREGKGALAVFLLAGTWWVFEVVPIGVTSLMIGILQALFLIRPAKVAFKDFMDPSVMFIFASLVIGTVFTKTGAHQAPGLQDARHRGRTHLHDLPGQLRGLRRAHAHHGPHRRGRHPLSAAGGHLRPVFRRPAHPHQVRQGPVHRHGLRGGARAPS